MEILAILGGEKTIPIEEPFVWPRITKKTEDIVIKQLHTSLSIYDDSGIFLEFKNKFLQYHSAGFGVLYNSGTSALYAMFRAIGLNHQDEIIVPVYTFFATATPIIYTGAKIKFCDCDQQGNLDPIELEKNITSKTKAVIVTHMRGMPCEMDKIVSICKTHDILLLEDCSHAHGAEFKNKKVGTFGDISIRSLQGQKIITGGEGGILLTKNELYYKKALLSGHFNKICKNAIDEKDELYKYRLTGFGLKLRAHPIAIAIANEQFDLLDQILYQKQLYIDIIFKRLSKFTFLELPMFDNKKPSRYALMIKYDDKKANNIPIDVFVKLLKSEGLIEVDIPKSTGLINDLDIFYDAAILGLYPNECKLRSNKYFPIAKEYYDQCFKLPVWGYAADQEIVEKYIKGIEKVCWYIQNNPAVLVSHLFENDKSY